MTKAVVPGPSRRAALTAGAGGGRVLHPSSCLAALVLCLGTAGAFLAFGLVRAPNSGEASTISVAVITLAACALMWLPGAAFAAALAGRLPAVLQWSLAITGTGAVGWVLFWAWFASPAFGLAATVVTAAGSVVVLTGLWRRLSVTDFFVPLAMTVLVAVAYVALASDHGGFAGGADMIAHRYWVSVDNKIPELFADGLLNAHKGLKPFLVGDWLSSDRPPLQTGMMMVGYNVAPGGSRLAAAFVLGVAANVLWVPALWSFLRSLKVKAGACAVVTVALALCGPLFINTVYTWPKLLAAALCLASFAFAVRSEGVPWLTLALSGTAAALSLLAHGAALFAVLVLPVLLLRPHRRAPWRVLVAGAAVALAVYAPWLGYQHFYNPPGDRLLKWHLAAVYAPTKASVLSVVSKAYSKAGALGAIRFKFNNLRMLVDPTAWGGSLGWWNTGWLHSTVGHIRMYLLTRVLGAPGLLLLAVPLSFLRRVRERSPVVTMAALAGGSLLVYVLLEYGGDISATTWLHTSPFAALVLICALCVLGAMEVSSRPYVVWALIALEAGFFALIWVVGVGQQSASAGPAGNVIVGLDVLAAVAFATMALLAVGLAHGARLRTVTGLVRANVPVGRGGRAHMRLSRHRPAPTRPYRPYRPGRARARRRPR